MDTADTFRTAIYPERQSTLLAVLADWIGLTTDQALPDIASLVLDELPVRRVCGN